MVLPSSNLLFKTCQLFSLSSYKTVGNYITLHNLSILLVYMATFTLYTAATRNVVSISSKIHLYNLYLHIFNMEPI